MRLATNNQDVIRRANTQILTAQRSLSYFEETLRQLQAKKQQNQATDGFTGPQISPGGLPPPGAQYANVGMNRMPDDRTRLSPMSPNGDWDGGSSQNTLPMPKVKNYTALDLVKADTPLTTAKISRMLHQLEFKLQVEKQYKNGIDKMSKLYQADLDRKGRDIEAKKMESKRVESDTKIQLLQTALKQYKNLHIIDGPDEDETPEGEDRKDNLRKPQSGKLVISIRGAKELDHAPFLKSGRSYKAINDTTVAIKVEGTQRAKTHPSRTDRWMEDFEIPVDKANEVEITIYDKQVGSDIPVPIGMAWFNLNDVVEALRRAKVQEEGKGGGWVTAGAMRDSSYSGSTDSSGNFMPQGGMGAGPPFGNPPPPLGIRLSKQKA
ncbi:hypothetical protein Clacol_003256 [Clathrus columnatus]|uniref:Protein kinase C n=1 Tax=Clathrus columnatus TaxID=1419009 RepID=A0AAV5A716_9AGAM|nr:hypothetical protein Clacol_003256 [Clathrus columnatus]